MRECVAFDLTVPGLDSSVARELLACAFGDGASAYVVATSRIDDSTTLYVETNDTDVNAVIGKLTDWFPQAPLGRVTRVARP